MVMFSHKESVMNFGKTIWVIYDTGWKAIRTSGDESLPLIFDTKEEADKLAENISFFKVEECILFKKNDLN